MQGHSIPLAAAAVAAVMAGSAVSAFACSACGHTLPADYHTYLHDAPELLGDTFTTSATSSTVWLDFGLVSFRYSPAERLQVLSAMQTLYSGFDISFSLTAPPVPAERIVFNNDGLGGVASEIDFRNQSVGVAFVGTNDPGVLNTSAREVTYAARIGAHELGHLLGLRHHDSQGPIGSGIFNFGGFFGWDTGPTFPGPRNANLEGYRHIMTTPAVGASFNSFINPAVDMSFSERSLIKLTFNEQGVTYAEAPGNKGSIATAQAIDLVSMNVLNTLPGTFSNSGETFFVDAAAVTGRIASSGQQDFYAIDLDAGVQLTVEVMSEALGRITDDFDTTVGLFDGSGSLVSYYGSTAFNDDEFETLDSILLDVLIPETGTYYIRVAGFGSSTGDYEMFAYTFSTVPEPTSLAGIALLTLGLVRRRRA